MQAFFWLFWRGGRSLRPPFLGPVAISVAYRDSRLWLAQIRPGRIIQGVRLFPISFRRPRQGRIQSQRPSGPVKSQSGTDYPRPHLTQLSNIAATFLLIPEIGNSSVG